MNWTPLNLTVRVGCHLAYETTVPTAVLFVLKPRLEGNVLVMQEKLSFGIGLPAYEFQDSHGNITYRSMFMPGRNEIRHDALVAISSLPDSREINGPLLSVGQLPYELLRYTLPSRYCDPTSSSISPGTSSARSPMACPGCRPSATGSILTSNIVSCPAVPISPPPR